MDWLETNEYVKNHGTLLPNGQVFLTKPLFVFKKVYGKTTGKAAVASLGIPIGAIVNLAQGSSCKLRANEAVCWSINLTSHGKGNITEAYSGKDSSFIYKPVKFGPYKTSLSDFKAYMSSWDRAVWGSDLLRPKHFFQTTTSECAAGIHFFVEVEKAIAY